MCQGGRQPAGQQEDFLLAGNPRENFQDPDGYFCHNLPSPWHLWQRHHGVLRTNHSSPGEEL